MPHETLCASVRNGCRATGHPGAHCILELAEATMVMWRTQGTQMQEKRPCLESSSIFLTVERQKNHHLSSSATSWGSLDPPWRSAPPESSGWSSLKCLHPGPSSWGSWEITECLSVMCESAPDTSVSLYSHLSKEKTGSYWISGCNFSFSFRW